MTDHEIAVVIPSFDSYSDLWEPFFSCFFEFWPDRPYPVYLITNFLEYKDSRIVTIQVGSDMGYSSNLIRGLDSVKESLVITWVDDLFLHNRVNNADFAKVINEALDLNVSYLSMTGSYPLYMGKKTVQSIYPIPKHIRYRVTMTIALWKKTFLQEFLVPGSSAWDIEKHGSEKSNTVNEGFYFLHRDNRKKPLLSFRNILIKGKFSRYSEGFIRNLGCQKIIDQRGKISLFDEFYIVAFNWRIKLLFLLRKYWI